MRLNPIIREVGAGLAGKGRAQLECLALVLLQAATLIVWWPKEEVVDVLTKGSGPNTLTAVVVSLGVALAWLALRAGVEEIMLPDQHGLRDWALATPLGPGRALRGYVAGQLIQSVHLVALSLPLLLVAFTVSGGEWTPLAWCIAAALVQALFFRLCGAITHVTIGQHREESHFTVRALLVVVYLAAGLLLPSMSHITLTVRLLDARADPLPSLVTAPDHAVFLAAYAGLSAFCALVLHRLLARELRAIALPRGRAGTGGEAAT